MDSIFDVIAWFMAVALSGKKPAVRHDGVRFDASKRVGDKKRAKQVGKDLSCKSGVVQERAG